MSPLTTGESLTGVIHALNQSPLLVGALAFTGLLVLVVTGLWVAIGLSSPVAAGVLTGNAVRRVARNSAIPMAAQLFNRVVDFGFTLVVLRVLGVEGTGQYEYAVLVWLYAKTLSDFGLGVLTTREVAVAPARAGRYLGVTTLLRLAIWASALPLAGAFTMANVRWYGLSVTSAFAIALLLASIVPDAYSDSANAICNAFERMAGPALLTVVKNLIKVVLGLLFLGLGWGVVALAVAALVNNVISAGLFAVLAHRLGVRARWGLPASEARRLLAMSWPLLLNNLLAGLFFRADIFVLQPARGAHEVGLYSAPYKFLGLVGIIPSYFTLALFPHFSRLALAPGAGLRLTYAHAAKLLLIVSFGIVVITEFLATDLMNVLAGPSFLPGSAAALRILILFLPLSYVNGLTQYVLIAAGQQHRLVVAFGLTFAFNVGANVLFTPRFGYPAAAIITVLSELVLLLPFGYYLWGTVGLPPLAETLLRPLGSALVMGTCGLLAWRYGPTDATLRALFAAIVAGCVYILALVVGKALGQEEWRLARHLLGRGA